MLSDDNRSTSLGYLGAVLQKRASADDWLYAPERDWRVYETFTGEQWLQRNRGGIPAGRDTAEVARRIRSLYGGRRQAD